MERTPMERALSTDLVLDIVMKHLKEGDLFNCRLVSKCWNKAASSVLRRRFTMIKSISMKKTLAQLGKCMKQSSDFPFAGLEFDQPWALKTARAMKFFQDYGARFTLLRLNTHWTMRLQELAPFINHLPRLSTLEVGTWAWACRPREQLLNPAAGPEEGQILKLASLRTIRIHSHSPELNEDVLRQVFQAASSSELRIECLDASLRILRTLENVGKLHAISVLDADEYGFKNDRPFNWPSTELPALTTLRFKDGETISRDGLMKLLISSQNTLEELCLEGIYPSEFSSECPVLAKLSVLSLSIEQTDEYLFQGGQGHKFPALKELTMDKWDISSPIISDGVFIVPSVTRIKLEVYIDKDGMEDLARSFPNVTEVRIDHCACDFEDPWSHRDPTDIWSVGAFKLLEKLQIWNYTVRCPTQILDNFKNYKGSINLEKFKGMNMDSFFTGISFATCENLRKHPDQNLMGSSFNEILRGPSLLQLKNLKELMVCVKLGDDWESEELPEEPPFISMVSVRYALEMMPKLTAKFVYDHSQPASNFCEDQDREKAGQFKSLMYSVCKIQKEVQFRT